MAETPSFIEKQIKGGYPMVEFIAGFDNKNELLGGSSLNRSHSSRFNNLIVPPSLYINHDLNNYNNDKICDVNHTIEHMPDDDFNKIFAIVVIDKNRNQTKKNYKSNKISKNKTKKSNVFAF